MCRNATTLGRTLAAAGLMLASAAACPIGAQPLAPQAEQSEDEADVPRRRGVMPEEEEQAEPQKPLPRLGASRKPDLVDAIEEHMQTPRQSSPGAARPAQDGIMCLAGCDAPKGAIIPSKPRPAVWRR